MEAVCKRCYIGALFLMVMTDQNDELLSIFLNDFQQPGRCYLKTSLILVQNAQSQIIRTMYIVLNISSTKKLFEQLESSFDF